MRERSAAFSPQVDPLDLKSEATRVRMKQISADVRWFYHLIKIG